MKKSRTQAQRTAQSKRAIIAAASHHFQTKGYAETSTTDILTTANLSRGALYHHYPDKASIFFAVCEQIHADLAKEIETANYIGNPIEDLITGSLAWLTAVNHPGPARVLLQDAPSVLTQSQWTELDYKYGAGELARFLQLSLNLTPPTPLEINLTILAINGAINELARHNAQNPNQLQLNQEKYRAVLRRLFQPVVQELSN